MLLLAPLAYADDTIEEPTPPAAEDSKSSPWLITPLLSIDPKISTAAGLLVGYIHKFDEESPPSMFAVMGNYSTTDSYYYGAFAKTHFGQESNKMVLAKTDSTKVPLIISPTIY